MATFKHISSKNARYSDAEKYLLFEHDEFTMKPILDESGRLIPREDYRIAALNCEGQDFAIACMRANLQYGKNLDRGDVKSHHYIISFDPRDSADNGLTVDRAQELGEQFCRDHFPGHQALVCTHPDGHNHTGNVHVHIVINSLRIEDVPMLPYMDRPADVKAGMKHRCTTAAMDYFKAEVMEMCHREGLYQVDLLNGSEDRVNDREYWAQKKGQAKLDKSGKPTKFETDKEKLRKIIRKALETATTFDEFSELLLCEGVTVKESRGRLSYLSPDRAKSITARKLGDAYDLAAVNEMFTQNALKQPVRHSVLDKLREAGSVQRLVDIDTKRAEGKGVGYEKWAQRFNLQQMVNTLNAYTDYGFASMDELNEWLSAARSELQESREKLKSIETVLTGKKELKKQLLTYWETKDVRQEYKALKTAKARAEYAQAHEREFKLSNAAAKYFKDHGITKLPSTKALQAEIQQLISEKNARYKDYREKQRRVKELETVKSNLENILGHKKEKRHELIPS